MELGGYYLPGEIILQIFSYLSSDDLEHCYCVSEEFKNVINDGYFWRNMCLTKGLTEQDMDLLKSQLGAYTWRELYWYDDNWRKGNFYEKKFKWPFYSVERVRCCQLNHSILFIVSNEKIRIYDLQNEPLLKQELIINEFKIDFFHVNDFYLIFKYGVIFHIYIKDSSGIYLLEKVLRLKYELLGELFEPGSALDLLFEDCTGTNLDFIELIDRGLLSRLNVNVYDDKLIVSDDTNVGDSSTFEYILCINTEKLYNIKCTVSDVVKRYTLKTKLYCSRHYVVIEEDLLEFSTCILIEVKVYDAFKNLNLMNLKSNTMPFHVNQPYNFNVTDQFIVFSFNSARFAKILAWDALDGRLIFEDSEDTEQKIQHFIVEDRIVFRIGCKVIIIDPIRGEKIRQFYVYNAMTFNFHLRNQLFAICTDRVEVYNAYGGRKLYTTILGAVHGSDENENFDGLAQFIENNFRYFCYFQEHKSVVFALDFSELKI